MNPSDPVVAATTTGRLVAVGVVIAAAELLVARRSLAPTGLFGWPVSRTAYPALLDRRRVWSSALGATLDRLARTRGTHALLACQLAIGAALVTATGSELTGPLLTVAAALSMLVGIRLPFGRDGSDQMRTVTLLVLAIPFLVGDPSTHRIAMWFLALNLMVSYLVAAIAKLAGAEWRSGTAIHLVLRTSGYGSPRLSRRLPTGRRWHRVVAWSVIGLELALAVSVVLPTPVLAGALLLGLAFHLGAAVLMGLNTFVWAYAGAYPAIWFCHHDLVGRLG